MTRVMCKPLTAAAILSRRSFTYCREDNDGDPVAVRMNDSDYGEPEQRGKEEYKQRERREESRRKEKRGSEKIIGGQGY